ncbi:MAG: diaminopimelate epimerase [Acidobacteria bacterium]|nr:diaminopimelate epimerase [Acidobacteriota bacterium]
MKFHKFQALGNDFLIMRESELRSLTDDFEAFSRRICDRHFGAGADGVELLLDRTGVDGADFEVRLFNSDGGETPISGNGTRCVAAYLYLVEGWDQPRVSIATGAGIKSLRPVERLQDGFLFETDMGVPKLKSAEIPVLLESPSDKVVRQKLVVDGRTFEFTSVSMGNPHCSIFVDDFDDIDWRELGAKIEMHQSFPDRTNVEFIRVVNRDRIEVRFWERGCGETLSSGTGSCAAAIASMLNGLIENMVTVVTVAGELHIQWLDNGKVLQTGEARAVFKGRWLSGE